MKTAVLKAIEIIQIIPYGTKELHHTTSHSIPKIHLYSVVEAHIIPLSSVR
jgi:hypothetical protein